MKVKDLVVGKRYTHKKSPETVVRYIRVLDDFFCGQHLFEVDKGFTGYICTDQSVEKNIREVDDK